MRKHLTFFYYKNKKTLLHFTEVRHVRFGTPSFVKICDGELGHFLKINPLDMKLPMSKIS